jgi:hypothetical protein
MPLMKGIMHTSHRELLEGCLWEEQMKKRDSSISQNFGLYLPKFLFLDINKQGELAKLAPSYN